MLCPFCGGEHPDETRFCTITGNPLPSPVSQEPTLSTEAQSSVIDNCWKCGAPIPFNVSFCTVCGAPVSGPLRPSKTRLPINIYYLSGILLCILLFAGLAVLTFKLGRLPAPLSFLQILQTSTPYIVVDQTSVPTLPSDSIGPTIVPTITLVPTLVPTTTLSPMPLPTVYASKINFVDNAEMVLVPAGEFLMGSDKNKDPFFWGAEAPEHTVTLDAYWIYRTEVTQGMYEICVGEKACPKPEIINHPVALQYGTPRFKDYPVTLINWQGAASYCIWAAVDLPTEAQWEKAARGIDGRLFPWGNNQDAEGFANYSSESPSEVGSYILGASPYGAYDMAGNVLEWVRDYFAPLYYQYSPLDNPLGPASGDRRVIRGGSFNQGIVDGLRTVARASLKPGDTKISVGFRCAASEP